MFLYFLQNIFYLIICFFLYYLFITSFHPMNKIFFLLFKSFAISAKCSSDRVIITHMNDDTLCTKCTYSGIKYDISKQSCKQQLNEKMQYRR